MPKAGGNFNRRDRKKVEPMRITAFAIFAIFAFFAVGRFK